MVHLYMAVPPQGSPTAAVETGVYLRMGTYVHDTTNPINEYSQMPSGFTSSNTDATTSEGIFITTAGTYIVTALEEAYIEVQNGVTQALTGSDGSMTTTVKEGNVSITIANGSFNLKGHSSFKVTSHLDSSENGISIKAENGKVSTKGDYVFNHTYGSYIKIAHANKKSGVHGPDLNISISLNLGFYGAVLFSAKLLTIGFKIFSASATGFTMTVGVVSLDFNDSATAYVDEDAKFAWLYIKYRGIQLEGTIVKDSASLVNKKTGLVSFSKGIAEARKAGIWTAYGIASKIP